MYLYQVFSFLGTIAIFLAAILISSKKAIKPKVRIWAFTFYIGACIYLGTMGALIPPPVGPDWSMIVQQIFLFFINCRGIYHARKQLSGEKEDSARHIRPYSNLSEVKPAGDQSEISKPLRPEDIHYNALEKLRDKWNEEEMDHDY